jgi:N-hydroxyarylamine O-acetyltransferase
MTAMDLTSYFDRIGFEDEVSANIETLARLHWLHPCAIPFENRSTLISEPVPLDVPALSEKLIRRRRGGYCFEQNTLFQAVLEAIGYSVTPLAARVVWNQNPERVNPRTHMVLLVRLADQDYLCDVGFGGATLTAPLKLEADTEQLTPHESFRLLRSSDQYLQEVLLDGRWRATYQFDLQPQQPIDYEALNYFVATHPSSHFQTFLMAGRPHLNGRYALGGNEFSNYQQGQAVEKRVIRDAGELKHLLTETFGIQLPTGEKLDSALERIVGTAASGP